MKFKNCLIMEHVETVTNVVEGGGDMPPLAPLSNVRITGEGKVIIDGVPQIVGVAQQRGGVDGQGGTVVEGNVADNGNGRREGDFHFDNPGDELALRKLEGYPGYQEVPVSVQQELRDVLAYAYSLTVGENGDNTPDDSNDKLFELKKDMASRLDSYVPDYFQG